MAQVFGSLIIVALGQPAWFHFLSPVAAALGFGLFWTGLSALRLCKRQEFYVGWGWFFFIQLVQLSWMTSIEFQGYYILFVYGILSLFLGLQFGFFSFLVLKEQRFYLPRILALCGVWTLLEWGRFYVLCGFSWNLLGLTLSSYPLSVQMASWVGVLGLSFWVVLTNLYAFYCLKGGARKSQKIGWCACVLFPYLYGLVVFGVSYGEEKKRGSLEVLLVQPGLLPSQKIPLLGREMEFISPWEQWSSILRLIGSYRSASVDLIALPESAVPFLAWQFVYEHESAKELIVQVFGKKAQCFMPDESDASIREGRVSNAFFCQFLANYFLADMVIGMDDKGGDGAYYSAAFHFSPYGEGVHRYEKRILLPLAEALPFAWARPLAKKYGIESFYTHGKESKVFFGRVPISLSICYEETFPDLMREGREKGAVLFVNVTNDNWYPASKLAKQHFDHGRLRAVENGVSLVRACNSGITSAVDCLGRTVGELRADKGALLTSVPIYQKNTLYTVVGDAGIVGICLGFLFFYGVVRLCAHCGSFFLLVKHLVLLKKGDFS